VDASVSWRDPDAPIVHPEILSGFGFRVLGMRVSDNTRDTAATIIPSVGCPMSCNFCTTSAFFCGKGKSYHFYESGDELFDVMQHMEQSMGVQSFFVMDENFLLNRPRAMQLLRRMQEHGKSWALYVFSSINAVCGYSMDELVRLGISWIWVGLESPQSSYAKLKNVATCAIVAELRSHGIKLLGSTIVGLEDHMAQNHRLRGFTRHGFSPVHAEHAGARDSAVSANEGAGECWTMSNWRTFTVSSSSTFGTPQFRRDESVSKQCLDGAFRQDVEANSGLPTRVLQRMLGPILAWISKREDRRLANGVTYQPQAFVERHNWLEESAESTQFRVVPVAQRGFRPSRKSIAARVRLPEAR